MEAYAWLFVTLGFFGALLTSASFIPQIYKSYRTRKLDDLSWVMLGVMCTGNSCWLLYGIFRMDWLIIGANSFIVCCLTSLIVMKVVFAREQGETP